MADDNTYRYKMRACPRIGQECRRGLARLESAAASLGERAAAEWRTALQSLEAEAITLQQYWSMGMANPPMLTHLLETADGLLRSLRELLSGRTIAMDRAEEFGPEPEREAEAMAERSGFVPIGEHTLPPLPYAYDALEPHIDEQTMRLHHDKHHKSYVDGLNRAEQKMAEARASGEFDLIRHWEREAAFNGAGHYLHTLFWNCMRPGGSRRPDGDLMAMLEQSFGGFEPFVHHFSQAALKVEAVGWAILVWAPRAQRLEVLTAEKHQNLSQWDQIPLLPLDVWEHAYYLKHQNDRAAYIADWWNVVNWPEVARRFEVAQRVRWEPY